MIIDVLTSGRSGFIIATDSGDEPTALVVGQVQQVSPDGEPEKWKAWLWPTAGRYPAGHVHAITRPGMAILREALRQQAARAPWWGVPPDRETAEGRARLEQAAAEYTARPA